MRVKLLLLFLLGLFLFNPVLGIEEKKVVRVAISNQNFSQFNHKNIKLSAQDIIRFMDLSQNAKSDDIAPNKIIEVIMFKFLITLIKKRQEIEKSNHTFLSMIKYKR